MKKVLIWGTGKVAKELLEYGLNAEIIGMIESYKKAKNVMDILFMTEAVFRKIMIIL